MSRLRSIVPCPVNIVNIYFVILYKLNRAAEAELNEGARRQAEGKTTDCTDGTDEWLFYRGVCGERRGGECESASGAIRGIRAIRGWPFCSCGELRRRRWLRVKLVFPLPEVLSNWLVPALNE